MLVLQHDECQVELSMETSHCIVGLANLHSEKFGNHLSDLTSRLEVIRHSKLGTRPQKSIWRSSINLCAPFIHKADRLDTFLKTVRYGSTRTRTPCGAHHCTLVRGGAESPVRSTLDFQVWHVLRPNIALL